MVSARNNCPVSALVYNDADAPCTTKVRLRYISSLSIWGLGQRPQQATWDLRVSENPRFGLCGSHEALLAGFSYPVFMPFRAVFLQMRKEDAYTSSFSSSASFNLMAPSMTPSTMGRYFYGQSCNLWLVRWRCSLSSRSSSGLK